MSAAKPPQTVILYDDDCGLCHNFVQLLLKIDSKKRLHYAAQGGEYAKEALIPHAENIAGKDSVYLLDVSKKPSRVFYYSDAALQTFKRLGYPWKAIWWLSMVPRFIRDSMYRFLARHRYGIFGKAQACLLQTVAAKDQFLDS